MRLSEKCLQCLYEKEVRMTKDEAYLREIRDLLEHWNPEQSAPYMEYCINQVYERHFGKTHRYDAIKKQFNDLMLSLEPQVRCRIEDSKDPLQTALFMARIGNYIDFGAMKNVNPEVFLQILSDFSISEADTEVYGNFLKACAAGEHFLLLADNSGELVLDKLMIEQLQIRFPRLCVTVMVRGDEVLNDATAEDAAYIGLDRICNVVSNGEALAGTEFDRLTTEARTRFEEADVILSKGQGNYESCSGCGKHVFYSFLCKCDVFTESFQVPRFTGMLLEEKPMLNI